MTDQLLPYAWPCKQLHEAFHVLIQKADLVLLPISTIAPPSKTDDQSLDMWFENVTFQSGLESVSVESTYAQLENMLLNAGPAIIRLYDPDNQPYFLVILKGGRKYISIITPESTVIKIDVDRVKKNLCKPIESPVNQSIKKILSNSGLSDFQQSAAEKAMLHQQLSSEIIDGCWLINLSPGADFFKWLRHLRIPDYFGSMLFCESMSHLLMILSWLVIGKIIFQFSYDLGMFTVWALLLLSVIPFKLFSQWFQCQISMNTGLFFKQRLLFGAMHLKQDTIRNQGPGQFMGRVMESEAFESLALDGGFDVIIFTINFGITLWLLMIACGWQISLVLILWLICCFVFCAMNYFATNNWIKHFRNMTHNIIERMTGYRTRMVQEHMNKWHDDEDSELNEYHQLSDQMDKTSLILNPVLTRGWMIIGIASISFFKPESLELLFISLGGIFLGYQSFSLLISGFSSFAVLLCSWQQVQPLFNAATHYIDNIPKNSISINKNNQGPLIVMRDMTYQYIKDADFKLMITELTLSKGDRILLEGPSGGGKSTLSALIAGERNPDTGIILLRGCNASQVGSLKWRKSIVLSPQFHENYIFSGSFAFNLLMGRNWPPKQDDIAAAKQVCLELGLNDLLQKMPEGLGQMLGETGWQLSHGEQSRIFMARALLQSPEFIIFDESFMPLDSENFQKVLQCVLDNDTGVMIIAHL
jgi:ATP-binding cassette subfamily B protein